MREAKKNNEKQQPKRKVKLSTKGKIVLVGLAGSLLFSGIGIGVNAHNKEVRLDQAAEVYANTMSRSELSMITSGYSPAEDKVISDFYENQRKEGNDLIIEIAGLNGLYDQKQDEVSFEDYEKLAVDYVAFAKEFAWTNVGQYRFSNYEQKNLFFYQTVDKSDGQLGVYIAVGSGDYSDNSFAEGLSPKDKFYVGNAKYLEKLVNSSAQVMDAMNNKDYKALRKSLTSAISIISNVTDQMYYIDENGVLNEVPVIEAQEQLIDEMAQNDIKIKDDGKGNLTVRLTDIHPEER